MSEDEDSAPRHESVQMEDWFEELVLEVAKEQEIEDPEVISEAVEETLPGLAEEAYHSLLSEEEPLSTTQGS